MSRPVDKQKSQDVRKHAANQRSAQTSIPADEPSSQHNLPDLMRYTLGYSTFAPIESMGLPGHLQELVGERARQSAIVGSAQLTRPSNLQAARKASRSPKSRGQGSGSPREQSRASRTPTQTPSQSSTSASRAPTSGSSVAVNTPHSRTSTPSPSQASGGPRVSPTSRARSNKDGGSDSRRPERIVCWR